MGQTLSEPVTNKETAICQDEFYKVTSGWSLCSGGKISENSWNNCVAIVLNPPEFQEKRFTPVETFLFVGRQFVYARMAHVDGRQPHTHPLTSGWFSDFLVQRFRWATLVMSKSIRYLTVFLLQMAMAVRSSLNMPASIFISLSYRDLSFQAIYQKHFVK